MIACPKNIVVRLKGAAMTRLRLQRYAMDGGRCVDCRRKVSFDGKDPKLPPMHLAHVRNKRMFGDTISNVRTKCSVCHDAEHKGGKPVPAKEPICQQ